MALQNYSVAVGAFDDADAGGKNYFAGVAVYIYNKSDDTLADIFTDDTGVTPIVQDGVQNVTNANGVFEFAIDEGQYYYSVDGETQDFAIAFTDHSALTSRNAVGAHDDIYARTLESAADFSSISLPAGIKVKTKGRLSANGIGCGEYTTWTLAGYRSEIGDGAWIADNTGFAFDMANGNVAVYSSSEMITVQHFGALGGGAPGDNQAFSDAADNGPFKIVEGVFHNIKISNKSLLSLTIEGGSFFSSNSSLTPALWIDSCTLDIKGNLSADGNKANNVNSFTDSDLSSSTSTLSIENCNGSISGNLKAVNSFHDGIIFDKGTNLEINGDIISKGMKNRGVLATNGLTGLKHTGKLVLADNDNLIAHGMRIGSLNGFSDTASNGFGDVYANNITGISVLFENKSANNTMGNIVSVSSDGAALKIEDNSGTVVGDVRCFGTDTFEGVIINSSRQVRLGDLYLTGCASDGLFIDSATGIGTNCEDITIGDVFVQGAGGDGIAVRSSISGATKNIVIGKVNVTDCQENGVRVYDNPNGVTINGGIIKNNNLATGFFDFRVDPTAINVIWSGLQYGTGSGQVADNGANPYKESGLNVKGYITFTVSAGTVTVLKQRGVTGTPTSPGTGDVFIVWTATVADNDPVLCSGNLNQDCGVRETTAAGNRSRIAIFNRGTTTPADTSSAITVCLME